MEQIFPNTFHTCSPHSNSSALNEMTVDKMTVNICLQTNVVTVGDMVNDYKQNENYKIY